ALAAVLHGEPAGFHLAAVTARSAWAFLYLVFVGALVGFSAYVWVLGVASPTLVGTYAFVNPGVAVLLG
ncbi:MAG: EamA family transporter, partial [Rhodospirillales bacterium]|nr:EamA family transporter [Acetobacter sp.]